MVHTPDQGNLFGQPTPLGHQETPLDDLEQRARRIGASADRRRPAAPPRPVNDHEAAFLEFHALNPHVCDLLVSYARHARARGHRRLSIQMLIERARWEATIETESSDGFKVNNNHAPYYARLIMRQEPDLDGMFDTRERRGTA